MAPHPCQSVQDQLSAYLDGELGTAERHQIEEHLSQCPACDAEWQSFRQLGQLFRESVPAETPPPWESVESRMLPRRLPAGPWWWSTTTAAAAAIAALLLVAVGFWASAPKNQRDRIAQPSEAGQDEETSMAGMAMNAEHMLEFQRTMNDYVAKLSSDPDQAERFLLTKYDGQAVSPDQAEALVGYQPLISRGLPGGYELASSSVVEMPCCTCFKAVCRRSDGSTLVLFEHDDDAAGWFGDRNRSMATCGDKDCCLIELDSNIAATWKEGSRSITAVGARDQGEVTMLVNALKRS
ncbi:hypothetical protein FYK55_23415 [Roseiconus nitratireducens]|uniref:Putative zinc-finger domain-containing protein n=1 Tax=Roseiconus nitratireducens TaxID=2605748 RepID=A0A5M6D258_9BACT|nr:zf-HC2 domain-containing protein [Roseiconus nitratireducens]KAA5539749.1 hypothetical protein FYK55_23415 [Roseiconus nitratireducens]